MEEDYSTAYDPVITQQWLSARLQEYQPSNVLRSHQMINWFRSRKPRDTQELYMHSSEQLTQKKMVKGVVTDMQNLRNMKHQIQEVMERPQAKELITGSRFYRCTPDPNPFKRTLGDWTALEKRQTFRYSQRIVQSRERVHAPGLYDSKAAQAYSKALTKDQHELSQCYLASLKEVEVSDDALKAINFVQGRVLRA